MSSQRHQGSAFKSGGATRLGSSDCRRHSPRQKKALPRDDSGIFSLSSSPPTPSRGTFPPTVPEEPGAMSNCDHLVCRDVDQGPPGRVVHDPVRRAGSQPNFVGGHVMQVSLRTACL